jgi:hypothetical protein
MALHRDILWIGRQWAVTGHGMQLIDQKLQGFFDIEVARLWDDDLIAHMHAKEWLNAADFDKGLAVARTRHKRPESAPPAASAPGIDPVAPPPPPEVKLDAPKPEPPAPVAVSHAAAAQQGLENPPPPAPPEQESPDIEMKIDGRARFVRPWRVWMKRKT